MKKNKVLIYTSVFFFIIMSITAGILITQNDPIEAAKKSQDEKLQVNSAEFIQATVLYYPSITDCLGFLKKKKALIALETMFKSIQFLWKRLNRVSKP